MLAKGLLILAVLLSSIAASPSLAAQGNHQVSVANWDFQVNSAIKAPQLSDIVHLGALDDGRDWLIVTLTGTNTSAEEQEIHSDRIQLQAGGQLLKQTGQESENVASELGYTSIGGSFPRDVDAGVVLEIVQVYKVDPNTTDFTLVFDFSGKWEVLISDLIAESAGNPQVLTGESGDIVVNDSPDTSDAWSISTARYRLTLIGAAISPTFSGPFHLGQLEDGRSWLVVTYHLHNTSSDAIEVPSESVSILSQGEEVRQAGEETRSVAAELDIVSPAIELDADEIETVVQVFKVEQAVSDNTLQVSTDGDWFINLQPVTNATNGDPNSVLPDASINLASLEADSTVAQAVPTAAPSPTPEPTAVPEPTAPPRYGSADNPAQVGETIEMDGLSATLISGFYTYEYNFGTPRGGYVFLIAEVQFQNVGTETMDYDSFSFAAKDLDTNADFDDTFVFLDTPLDRGELSPGEYVYGQVAMEVQETSTNIRVKYTPDLGIFGSDEAIYWLVPRQ
jgi:hypothetical protein